MSDQAAQDAALHALWARFLPPPPLTDAADLIAIARGCVAARTAADVTDWQLTQLIGVALARAYTWGVDRQRAQWAENTAEVLAELEVLCDALREQHASLTND